MSFLSKLFGKKKEKKSPYYMNENDGQDLYFREDYEENPKKKSGTTKKAQANPLTSEANETEISKADTKIKADEKTVVKKDVPKTTNAKVSNIEQKAKTESNKTASAGEKKPVKKATPSPTNKTETKSNRVTTKPNAQNTKSEPAKATATPKKEADTPKKEAATKASPTTNQKEAKGGKSGRFEIKKAKDGRFVFNLYAPNHIIVATSQVYSTSAAAVNGIQSIITNAEKAPIEDNTLKNPTKQSYPKWEMYIDKGGEYRFRLYASNGNCVVHSQGYKQKSSCKNGIESIIRCSRNAEIDKSYLKKE